MQTTLGHVHAVEDVAIDEIVSDVDAGLDMILAGIEALKNKWGTVRAE